MKIEDTKTIQKKQNESALRCKTVSSTEKIFPQTEPEEIVRNLTGLKGETVSFQIAYFWNGRNKLLGELSDISVSFSLSKAEGKRFSQEEIRIRKVLLVPCMYPSHKETDEDYLCTEPGLYPDLLRDVDEMGFPVISEQWRSLWVDFEIPKDASAGTYEIQFMLKDNHKVNSEEHFCETVIVGLEIIDQELPELDIPHTEWLHCDCLAEFYHVPVFREQHWHILENFIKIAAKRKCNMIYTPVFTPPLDTAVGGERLTVQLIDVTTSDREPTEKSIYSFGFEKFERWISMCESCGIQYFEISHLFTQWGATAAPKIIATAGGKLKKIFGWETESCGGAYRNFMIQFLKAFDRELHALNIQDRVYFHVSDEPRKEQLDTYRATKELVADQLKDYHVIDAISDYDFYENQLIEEPICSSDHIKEFLDPQKRPEKLWVYYCTVQNLHVSNRFMSMPGSRTRILGDMIYRQNVDGFLHWGFNFYNSQYSLYPIDPYLTTDADGAFPSGDPFLVYPGKDGLPEESLRMMLMDEAFSDYCALKLLENLTDRETAVSCLEEESFGELTFDSYPKNNTYVRRVRNNVNKKIKEILGGGENR